MKKQLRGERDSLAVLASRGSPMIIFSGLSPLCNAHLRVGSNWLTPNKQNATSKIRFASLASTWRGLFCFLSNFWL